MSLRVQQALARSNEPGSRVRQDSRLGFPIALGIITGALAGVLLVSLGLDHVLGTASAQPIVLVCAALGAALGFFRRLGPMVVIDVLLLVVVVVIADTPIMAAAAGAWVRSDAVPPRADAIVVLSASINSSGRLRDQGLGRTLTGLELFQRGLAPRLFTTAIRETFAGVARTSVPDQERIVTLGGARDAWASTPIVHITRDEAMQTAALLPADQRSVIVVTSPMHTRRACATFEAIGLKVSCIPSREQEYEAWHPVTSRERLESFRQYAYERLGMVKYRAKGWLPKGQ